MSEIVLNAEMRETKGKHAKYARSHGFVPGVYYTRGEKNLSIQVTSPNLDPIVFTSEMRIIDLRLEDGSSRKCILKDVQFDPVTDRPIHFDLLGLHENEKLTIEIPISLTGGAPKGIKDGGVLQHIVHRLRISCLPKDIPEKVEVNVAELGINDFVHVRDLVVPPIIVKEPAPGEAVVPETPAEPEVVAKGKKAEEGEEGAAAPPQKEAKPQKETKS
jgi:large subunit ribosomal protein L25